MSGTALSASRAILTITISMTAALFLTATGFAQAQRDSDLLDQVRRMEKVKADKIEADLRSTLQEVQRLTPANSAKAVERLKTALVQIEDDTILPEARRMVLIRMLKDRIRVTEADAKPTEKTAKQPPVNNRLADEQRRLAEQNRIKERLKAAQNPQQEDKIDDAARATNVPAGRSTNSKEEFAQDRIASRLDQAAENRKLRDERERSNRGASLDIDRSASPANGDLEFPRDWTERTKGRTTAPKLTVKEKALIKALNTPISVSFRNSRLEDVIEYLKTVLDQPILMDSEAMKEVEASYDTPITLNLKNVSARTILHKILADINMNYVIKDETIHVTSAREARRMMVVRRYYIGDLIGAGGALTQLNGLTTNPLGNPLVNPLFNPLVNPLANLPAQQNNQTAQTVNMLIEMIKSSVDSQSWQTNGGEGTISFHAPSMSLIVKQSAEVHTQMSSAGFGK
jgi:hypothetical protein